MDEILGNVLVGIPETTANLQLPDPTLRDYYRDEQDRVFWVNEQIDASLLDLVKMIMRCNKEDKDVPVEDRVPIKVFIDSPGGDVLVLWTVIKAIELSKTPVYTINYCTAYSAAAEILVAGQKRFSMPGTQTMFHRGSNFFGGEASVVESTRKHFDKLEDKLRDFLLTHTNISPKAYKKNASSDIYYDENDCLKFGVIDEILTDYDVLF